MQSSESFVPRTRLNGVAGAHDSGVVVPAQHTQVLREWNVMNGMCALSLSR
jgi:hypothetical protein